MYDLKMDVFRRRMSLKELPILSKGYSSSPKMTRTNSTSSSSNNKKYLPFRQRSGSINPASFLKGNYNSIYSKYLYLSEVQNYLSVNFIKIMSANNCQQYDCACNQRHEFDTYLSCYNCSTFSLSQWCILKFYLVAMRLLNKIQKQTKDFCVWSKMQVL